LKTAADAILFQLKSLGEAQAETLARRLGISVQAVRQRLDRLLAEDLVCFSDRSCGRGRPRRFWSLASGAAGLFPDTHAQLTVDLIGSIRRGYMARLERHPGGGFLLIEDHCPICAAAAVCQGFCSIEIDVFRSLLGPAWDIAREDHVLGGARRCSYRIIPAAPAATSQRPVVASHGSLSPGFGGGPCSRQPE